MNINEVLRLQGILTTDLDNLYIRTDETKHPKYLSSWKCAGDYFIAHWEFMINKPLATLLSTNYIRYKHELPKENNVNK